VSVTEVPQYFCDRSSYWCCISTENRNHFHARCCVITVSNRPSLMLCAERCDVPDFFILCIVDCNCLSWCGIGRLTFRRPEFEGLRES
jgi:hypothetical protein